MKRKPGTLLPLEEQILLAGLRLRQAGERSFHGYAVARALSGATGSRRLTSQGTLYKALDRLAGMSLLKRSWEDPAVAETEGRPRRRLYEITAAGEQAVAAMDQKRLGRVGALAGEGAQ